MLWQKLLQFLGLSPILTNAYTLVKSYDASNWYNSFDFQNAADPTHGFVQYITQSQAAQKAMTYTMGNQIYFGVDNSTVLPNLNTGRKSIWMTSKESFLHGILVADFAHVPSSTCGLWPGFWTIRNDPGPYGEIDIMEGFSCIEQAYTTLHTKPEDGPCTFDPPPGSQTGKSNQNSYDCAGDIGCSVVGAEGSYGTTMNDNGGGVYAMDWTSNWINVYFFPRNAIPEDIAAGKPNPQASWGTPVASFDTRDGGCDIDAHFPPQTIYFDTTFCGAEAGGVAWSTWSGCAESTGYATCEEFVQKNPQSFNEAYWLVKSVKVYQ